jgi:hypothetical protein
MKTIITDFGKEILSLKAKEEVEVEDIEEPPELEGLENPDEDDLDLPPLKPKKK